MTDFADLFDSFSDRAFRFESLPTYAVAEEAAAFEAFRANRPIPPGWLDDWTDFVRETAATGRAIVRVRLTPEPTTPYFEFERTCGYPQSREAGETILAIHPSQLPPTAVGVCDFWLFDDTTCATLSYDTTGAFSGVTIIEDPKDVASFVEIASDLLAVAAPLRINRQ